MTDDTVQVDINKFAEYMAEVRKKEVEMDDSDSEAEELLDVMQAHIDSGKLYEAYECARELRIINFSRYRDRIYSCFKTCADLCITDAMMEMFRLLTNIRTGEIKPEAFPYIQRLSKMGYIESFRWLGDCYYSGIGCTKDISRAGLCYFEAVLFDSDRHSRLQLQKIYKNSGLNNVDDIMSKIMKSLIIDNGYQATARVKVAEMILDGQLSGYEPETAYYLLKNNDSYDGIRDYKLGECLLNGLGTETNPVTALDILWNAQWQVELTIDELEDKDIQNEIQNGFHGNYDFEEVLENINEMMKEAETKIRKLREEQGCIDEEQILDDWEKEKISWIRRTKKVTDYE